MTVDSGISCQTPARGRRSARTRSRGHRRQAGSARCPDGTGWIVSASARRRATRSSGRRVARGPQRLAVADAEGGLDRVLDPVARGGRLDEADGALERARRDRARARRSARGGTGPRSPSSPGCGEQRRVDGEHEIAANVVKPPMTPLCDEQPAAVAEGMAVRLLDRVPIVARTCAMNSGDSMWRPARAGSRRPRPGDAVVDAGPSPAPYQPKPKPSPFVVSAPMRECRLWSIIPCWA